ncbi:MAG: [Fe-S]-binding protein [Bacteroidetes bacterium]|nr:MAG: [Fe-S]-binding protein [Bacteroidota bacterium]
MNKYYKKFLRDADKVSFDLKHRKTIKFNMSKYDAAVEIGFLRYKDKEKAKESTAYKKRDAIKKLDESLLEFEANAIKNGINVHWALDESESHDIIGKILDQHNAKMVVKMKSMTTEEIELNDFIINKGIESVETDLGEFIVQVAGEKPYHIVTPAMHKSKKDVNELFSRLFGMNENSTAEEMTEFVRQLLRKKFTSAEVGITGANFLIADIGGVGITENEGNGIMSTSFPKTHIVVAGIEKIIPKMTDLDLFWPVLSSHGTGQAITVYNTIFTGSKKSNEEFGPEEMHVILLDNGRTEILNQEIQSDILACIRCGACLNACPVYKNIGGYTYEATYGGPIGSIISPFYQGFEKSAHLSYACTICGKCTEVCPEKIDLHMLLLHNRNLDVENYSKNWLFTIFMNIYQFIILRVKFFDIGLTGFKNFIIKNFASNVFGKKRTLPPFKKSFKNQYLKSLK